MGNITVNKIKAINFALIIGSGMYLGDLEK